MTALFLSAFKDRDGATIHHFMSWFDVSDRVNAEQEIGAMRQLQATLSEREEQLPQFKLSMPLASGEARGPSVAASTQAA